MLSVSNGRPTIAEIDLSALRANYHALCRMAPESEMMAVIKADAYGHGAVEVSRALAGEGCRHFGVATVEEARVLRSAGADGRIYLLGGFFPAQAHDIIALNITPMVFDNALIEPLEEAARSAGKHGFAVHLKVDTGATRLGVRPEDLNEAADRLRQARSLELEGVCTLLATASDPGSPATDRQIAVFRAAVAELESIGLKPRFKHIANSAALVLRKDTHFNMVRAGLALYGLPPVPAVREQIRLTPVMSLKTRLLQIKNVPAGTGVSYGHTFITQRPSVIGVLAVGYADGYCRGLQHGAEVLINGHRAPVVGAVCMDLTMVDLTGLPDVAAGDEVVLWGGSGDNMISVNDVARLAHTISYEILCTVGRRVARVYRN